MWTEAETEDLWSTILGQTFSSATLGFRWYEKPDRPQLFGVPGPLEDDENYRFRFFYFIKPLLTAVEEINKSGSKKLEKKDIGQIVKLFSPWTLIIDHLTFTVGLERISQVNALFYETGFRNITVIESSISFPAYGYLLERDDTNTGRKLYIAVLEGQIWQGGDNIFQNHALEFGERTPIVLSLDISQLVPMEERGISHQTTHLELKMLAHKLFEYFQKRHALPLDKTGLKSGFLRKDGNVLYFSFSTVPLKYGLRLQFIERIKLAEGRKNLFPN